MSRDRRIHREPYVRHMIAPLGAALSDAQLQRRIGAARRSLLLAVPAAGGTSFFVAEQRLVAQGDGLYLEMQLQQRPQRLLFAPTGESPTEPPCLRDEAIRRCGDIHAAVDGAKPENPVERSEIQGALERLDGAKMSLVFSDGQLELTYPTAPMPDVRYAQLILSGHVTGIGQRQLRLQRPRFEPSGNDGPGIVPPWRLKQRLSVVLVRGSPDNPAARLAAVHAMNAREALRIRAIAAILPDEDTIREVRFTGLCSDDTPLGK